MKKPIIFKWQRYVLFGISVASVIGFIVVLLKTGTTTFSGILNDILTYLLVALSIIVGIVSLLFIAANKIYFKVKSKKELKK